MSNILDVPFVKNLKKWKGSGWCGPIALASILRYYKDNSTVEKNADFSKASKLGGGTIPEGLVYFCLVNNYNVDFFRSNRFAYKNYSKRYASVLKNIKAKELINEFNFKLLKSDKYNYIQKQPTLKEIKSYIDKKRPVLLYFNVAIIEGLNKIWPHYVVVVGYDKDYFYVHNIYPKNIKYQQISKKLFEEAWKSDYLNDFLMIPYKPQKSVFHF